MNTTNLQDILTPAQREIGLYLAAEEDFILLKRFDDTLAHFTHHATDEAIRKGVNKVLEEAGR